MTAVPAAAPVAATPLAQMIARDGATIGAIPTVRPAARIVAEEMAALQTVKAAVLTAAKETAILTVAHPAQATVIAVAADALEAVLAAVHLALDSCGNEKGRTKWTWHLNRTTTQEAKRRIPKIKANLNALKLTASDDGRGVVTLSLGGKTECSRREGPLEGLIQRQSRRKTI